MIWIDGGYAVSIEEFIAMVKANLEWLDPKDPAYNEQLEILRGLEK